jgi:tetratricopeptide (TPR) repeat protein
VAIYNNIGRYAESTETLEFSLDMFPGNKDLSEALFFSYVREGKLLKQQNQALTLYKAHQQENHAQWAVESMYLISLNLKFETKVLDIAYLLMLKLMKEPKFVFDKKFVLLHIKILSKQLKFKDAIDFIDRQSEFFQDKLERQTIESGLYLLAGNHILAINTYFNMLRINSHINQYSDMNTQYRQCIAIIIDDFLPKKKKHELKSNIEALVAKADTKGVNFDPITIEAEPEEVLINLIASCKNLRKNIAVDGTSKRVMGIANEMKRTSYLSDLEYKFMLALNYP